MATTKHQPATPLPFRIAEERSDYAEIVGPLDGTVAYASQEYAAYLAHAANSYPKLVEALRNLALRCDGAEGVRADGSNIDTAHAAGLLRELGEDA